MTDFIVRKVNEAFNNKNYSQALQLYREASEHFSKGLFEANIKICQKRFHINAAKQASADIRSIEFFNLDKKIKYADRFRVALIADEFTTNSFSDEFDAIPIKPSDWRERFEKYQPEILFCESAWSGTDPKSRPWKGQIYASKNFKKENRTVLLEILAHCKKMGIPTVFWNKEDPTHFTDRVHDFVKTAKEFDFVFTTAAECVGGYQNEHGVSKAFALPFATNPRLFNPVENGFRSSRVVLLVVGMPTMFNEARTWRAFWMPFVGMAMNWRFMIAIMAILIHFIFGLTATSLLYCPRNRMIRCLACINRADLD